MQENLHSESFLYVSQCENLNQKIAQKVENLSNYSLF